jgi:hypothetical protein
MLVRGACALVAVTILVVLAIVVLWDPAQKKEGYGPPPGLRPAVRLCELGFRGWPDMPKEYEGNTASSVSAYAENT